MSEVSEILNSIREGEDRAAEKLLPLVYEELRKLASHRMAGEAPGQTLQPTALVHEAFLRLVGSGEQQWHGRAHFFGAAAEAMRRILIENARRKKRLKHGGELRRIDFKGIDVAIATDDEQLLALDEALQKLETHDPQAANLIKLRFFAGLTNLQAAEVLGLSERSGKRLWAYARAWLLAELSNE